MATTVGSHSISTFATPVNGGPLDANVVRGNDNTIKTAYVAHDADTGIHVQSSTLAARPAAGTAGRKWITEDSGVYTLWFDDGTNWHPVSSENVALTVLATENLAKGDVVKVVGWNNGQDLPEVAKVASASDVAFAIITAAVTNGAMGYATNTGIVQDLNTNAFSAGTILYPNASGGFTSTKPTSGNYQPVAFVLRSNSNNGVLYVEFSAPRIVERSDNTASTIVLRDASGNFSAGTITAGALTASGAVSAGSVTSTGLVTFASLKGTGATTVTNIINDGTMATASATTLATSSSIKTYVDSQVATVDTLAEVLANGNTTGANDIIVNAGQKIRTPLIASQNNATAITIADTTGALTLASALADSNLATISTAGKVSNSATTATSANTASAIVARDASGNFTAGTITAALTGNASTATTLQTARNINGVSFNGSADITVTAAAGTLTGNTLASGVTASSLTSVGTLTSLTVSGSGSFGGYLTLDRATDVGMVLKVGGVTNGQITSSGTNIVEFRDPSFVTRASMDSNGNLAVDTNTLYVDAANNRVGVGRTDPGVTFDASADGAGGLSIVRLTNTSTSAGSPAQLLFASSDDGTTRNRAAILSGDDGANNGYLSFSTRLAGAIAVKMRLDANGNLGLGTAPSAWGSTIDALQMGTATFAASATGNTPAGSMYVNSFFDGTNFKYVANGEATRYASFSGQHVWYQAASGTAGNNITFTQAMTLDASGNLGVGVTPPTSTVGVSFKGSSGDAQYRLYNSTSGSTSSDGVMLSLASDLKGYLWNYENEAFIFGTNNAERARITSGGDFLIGSTSGSHKLSVTVASGADRDIAIMGVAGASNGFRVTWNHANLKTYIIIADIPTSSAGLPAGTLYSDGGTIKIA